MLQSHKISEATRQGTGELLSVTTSQTEFKLALEKLGNLSGEDYWPDQRRARTCIFCHGIAFHILTSYTLKHRLIFEINLCDSILLFTFKSRYYDIRSR